MTLFVSVEQQKKANFTHAYNLAGNQLLSQQPIALIQAFEVDYPLLDNALTDIHDDELKLDQFDTNKAKLIYRGKGSFSGGMKKVSVWEKNNVQLLQVGESNFSLTNFKTGHIKLLGDFQVSQPESAEILLGPPLLTLLATKSIFCLHAGAVATEHGTAVFIGESGKGKSTLSQDATERTWSRLGDDIMPVVFHNNDICLLPRFPQLKRNRQYLDKVKQPLSVIFRLLEPATNNSIQCQPVKGSEALISLARHTAASRVFNEEILAKNMVFNQAILSQIPVYDLSYPRDISRLDDVRNSVAELLFKS